MGEQKPYFSFRRICQKNNGFSRCSHQQLKKIGDKLRILSDLTWGKIYGDNRNNNGFEMIPTGQFKATICDEFATEKSLMVFNFGGGGGSKHKGRLVGVKRETKFYVLLIDSNMKLYDHGK